MGWRGGSGLQLSARAQAGVIALRLRSVLLDPGVPCRFCSGGTFSSRSICEGFLEGAFPCRRALPVGLFFQAEDLVKDLLNQDPRACPHEAWKVPDGALVPV